MSMIRIFVYGTLKRGFWNHDRFCGNAVSIEEATVCGRLYEHPGGFPMLEVPEKDILAVGTDDPAKDGIAQDSLSCLPAQMLRDGCHLIEGELLQFNDGRLSLPPIDRLEGFRPGQHSLYVRVLVPIHVDAGLITGWCYVASTQSLRHASPSSAVSWEPQ